MQISFNGIKNISYESIFDKDNCGVGRYSDILNAQLTDDKSGMDLTEYRDILKKVTVRNGKRNISFNDIIDDTAINIKYKYCNYGKNRKLYINGVALDNEKTIDTALPLIIYVNKLINKIRNMSYDQMVVENDYLKIEDDDKWVWHEGDKGYSKRPELPNTYFDKYMNDLYDRKAVKKGNNYIGKVITQFLSDFLISSPKIKETAEEVSLDGGFKRFT